MVFVTTVTVEKQTEMNCISFGPTIGSRTWWPLISTAAHAPLGRESHDMKLVLSVASMASLFGFMRNTTRLPVICLSTRRSYMCGFIDLSASWCRQPSALATIFILPGQRGDYFAFFNYTLSMTY